MSNFKTIHTAYGLSSIAVALLPVVYLWPHGLH